MKLITHVHLVPSLRTRGAVLILPPYVFTAWLVVKHRNNFTSIFNLAYLECFSCFHAAAIDFTFPTCYQTKNCLTNKLMQVPFRKAMKLRDFKEPGCSSLLSQKSAIWPCSQFNPFSTFTYYVSAIHFNIAIPSTLRFLKWSLQHLHSICNLAMHDKCNICPSLIDLTALIILGNPLNTFLLTVWEQGAEENICT
jgi:hypothetical protein